MSRMRYGCSRDAGGASRGIAERLPGSNRSRRSENDHRFGRLPHIVATWYLCSDNFFLEMDVVLWILPCEDGRTLRALAPHYTLGETLI